MAQEDKIIFCTGGGCTAKLGAGVLSHILEKLPRGEPDPKSAILLAMVVVGGTGLLIAILLGIASEKFKVPVDEK